jgi:hypothetical protein
MMDLIAGTANMALLATDMEQNRSSEPDMSVRSGAETATFGT